MRIAVEHDVHVGPWFGARCKGDAVQATGLALHGGQLASAWDFRFGFDVGYALSGVVFQAGASEATGLADLTLALRVGVSLRL